MIEWSMEMASVEAFAMSSPIDPEQQREFHTGRRLLKKRDFVLIKIVTKDGVVGYAPAGASSSAMREYFSDSSQQKFTTLIQDEVGAELHGTEIDDPEDIRSVVDQFDLPTLLRSQTIAALDIAYHDIRGKIHGTPIYELIGDDGATRTLDLYASAGMYMDPEGYVAQAETLRDWGFFGYKYRPGIGPSCDRDTFRRLCEISGEMELMADAHTWWKIKGEAYGQSAVYDIVDDWSEDAYWIEEPVAPDDYEGYKRLAKTGASLAGGESEESAGRLISLAQTDAIEFLQGDVRHHGGFTGCLEAVEYCNGSSVQYVPHHFGTLLGLVANAHLVAGAVDGTLLEYPVFENDPYIDASPDPGMYPFELAFDVINTDLNISSGRLEVPDAPGLGVDVNEDVVEAYPFEEGAWTEFRYNSE